MKRLVSNKSWKEIYGQKWQNIESSMESESNDDDLHSSPVESTVTPQIFDIEAARQEPSTSTTGHGDEENIIPKGKRVGGRTEGESMYRAALVGDWKDAEKLLGRDPKLAFDYVTEEGDRALHVAAAMKHKYFVQKLIKRMSDNDLMLLDGRGYTACCYAAISGVVEIARFMIEKNRNLVTAHDEEKKTPLHKAAFRGNNKMLSYLLESTQVEDLSKKEWFDLLLVTIRGEMYDVAIKVLEKNGSIATMVNEEGTALHLLGLQEIPNARNNSILMEIILDSIDEGMEMEAPELSELAEKLWAEMQNLEKGSLLELIRKPLLLHDAAKAGHVELVTMLTRTYPQLIWDTDSNGYTLFHLAVIYRQVHVFNLIHQVDAMIGFRTIIWQDQDGNNILHLAAKLGPPNKTKLSPALQIQRELLGLAK